MEKTLRILAMDLSMNLPAFAVMDVVNKEIHIVDVRYCNNKKNTKLSHGFRLSQISKMIKQIMLDFPDIDVVVREKGFTRFAGVTQTLFKVVGISDLVIYEGIGVNNIYELSPTSVKKTITGDGKASKIAVEKGVRKYLTHTQKDYEFATDDCSDAVAVGIAWLITTNSI